MWQNPYVDVFRKFSFFDGQTISKVGGVSEELDSAIGKKIYSIKGTTPSSNYILAPTGSTKSLGLVGRYIYLFVNDSEEKNFTIHLDFTLSNSNNLRISLSTLFKIEKLKDPFSVLIPITLTIDKWTCIIVDVKHLKDKHKIVGEHTLKSFTITCSLKVSRIITTDNIYTGEEIPREVNFKLLKGQRWLDLYELVIIGNQDVLISKSRSRSHEEKKEIISEKTTTNATITKKIRDSEEKKRKFEQILNKENIANSAIKPVSNEPLFSLNKVVGFSSQTCPFIHCGKDPKEKAMYYTSGSVIIKYTDGQQSFYIGHTSNIVCLDVNATHIASIDNTLKVWNISTHKIVADVLIPLSSCHTVTLSSDSSKVAVAGFDSHNRDTIVVWEISSIPANKEPYAKQISFFNILCIKFSPFEETD